MKSITTSLFIIFFSTQLFSQELKKEEIIGTWKVVNCQIKPEFQKKMEVGGKDLMELLKTGFMGTVFGFDNNNNFTLKLSNKNSIPMEELEFLNNKQWKIEKGEKIGIGTDKDNFSGMKIIVLNKDGKKHFILWETPLILEVVKQ